VGTPPIDELHCDDSPASGDHRADDRVGAFTLLFRQAVPATPNTCPICASAARSASLTCTAPRPKKLPPSLPAAAVLAQVSAQEAEIERIRNEQYVEPATAAYDPSPLVCPAGHGPLTPGTRFCHHCGQPGVPRAAVPTIPCPTCGTPLQPDARFCFNCGQPMTSSPPPPAPAPTAPSPPPAPTDPTQPETVRLGSAKPTCPSCGEPVLNDAESYCATCGYPLKGAT